MGRLSEQEIKELKDVATMLSQEDNALIKKALDEIEALRPVAYAACLKLNGADQNWLFTQGFLPPGHISV